MQTHLTMQIRRKSIPSPAGTNTLSRRYGRALAQRLVTVHTQFYLDSETHYLDCTPLSSIHYGNVGYIQRSGIQYNAGS
jgi:hypothetical protein